MSTLQGKKALMIIASNDFRDEELFKPRELFIQEGIEVVLASSSLKNSRGMLGKMAHPDILIEEVKVEEEPKAKKTPKKTTEMNAERKAKLLEQLARGRETARKNREAKKSKSNKPDSKESSPLAKKTPEKMENKKVNNDAQDLARELRELKEEMRELNKMKRAKREASKKKEEKVEATPAPSPEPVVQHSAVEQKPQPQYKKILDCRTGRYIYVAV